MKPGHKHTDYSAVWWGCVVMCENSNSEKAASYICFYFAGCTTSPDKSNDRPSFSCIIKVKPTKLYTIAHHERKGIYCKVHSKRPWALVQNHVSERLHHETYTYHSNCCIPTPFTSVWSFAMKLASSCSSRWGFAGCFNVQLLPLLQLFVCNPQLL